MMSAYVCRQCRARLTQRLPNLRGAQWQTRATFISLRNENISDPGPDTRPSAHTVQKVQPRIPDGKEELRQDDTGTATRRPNAGRQARSVKGGRYAKYAPVDNSIVQEPISAEPEDAEGGNDAPEKTNTYAARIDKHLQRRDLSKAWAQFLESYPSRNCPALAEPSYEDLNLTTGNSVFGRLLQSVLYEYCRGGVVPVTPTTALHKFEILGVQRPDNWKIAIRKLTDSALASVAIGGSNTEAAISELLSVWRLFFQCKGTVDMSLDTLDTEWKSMPEVDKLRELMADPTIERDFNRRLQSFHPNSVGNAIMGFSALSIFTLLNEQSIYASKIPETIRTQHAPFLRFLTGILPGSNTQSMLKHTTISTDFLRLPESFRTTFSNQVSDSPSAAMILIGEQGSVNVPMTEAQKATAREQFLLKRIARTVTEKAHQDMLHRLWDEALKTFDVEGKPQVPLIIYNAFLTGFLSLFAADQTVQVWNHMVAHGVKPDVTTWTSMLTGCVQARDLNGLNKMWERMVRTGVQPDNYAWTTRVNGLISLREINAGFAALDEMGKTWRAGEHSPQTDQKQVKKQTKGHQTKDNPYTKPSIEVINGAISALAKSPSQRLPFDRKRDFVHKVLQWAGSFGIKPDAYTYNTLIKLHLHGDDYTTVFNLLRQMEAESIPADLATYTMLLRASFDNEAFAALDPSTQASHVTSLFTQLESSGLRLNTVIYASTIDKMLKQYKNFPAVRAVIDHMLSRNMSPGAYIYTSLFTHYFQCTPPNIPAADSLWLQILKTPGAATDKFLFDRIIEGYAAVGEVGKMMTVLTRMSKHGKLPGWPALLAVVRALVQAGDWERARNVVRDVACGEGVAKGGITGGMHGQEHFFHVVENELGILGGRGRRWWWRERRGIGVLRVCRVVG